MMTNDKTENTVTTNSANNENAERAIVRYGAEAKTDNENTERAMVIYEPKENKNEGAFGKFKNFIGKNKKTALLAGTTIATAAAVSLLGGALPGSVDLAVSGLFGSSVTGLALMAEKITKKRSRHESEIDEKLPNAKRPHLENEDESAKNQVENNPEDKPAEDEVEILLNTSEEKPADSQNQEDESVENSPKTLTPMQNLHKDAANTQALEENNTQAPRPRRSARLAGKQSD